MNVRTTEPDLGIDRAGDGGDTRGRARDGDRTKHYPEEAPVHRVTSTGFWIERTPVTNTQFRRFVKRPAMSPSPRGAGPKGLSGCPAPHAQAGLARFSPPHHPVELRDWPMVAVHRRQLAALRTGASSTGSTTTRSCTSRTRTPRPTLAGPARSCRPRPSGSSPRAAGSRAEFAWGDEFTAGGRQMANTWQGISRSRTSCEDGYKRTSPVEAFPPNGYGIHDMIGNVWEWTTTAIAPGTRPMPRRRAASRRTRAAERGRRATIPASRRSGFRARCQGRLAPVRAELLPPLPAGGAPCAAGRHLHQPRRVPVRVRTEAEA